MSIRHVEATWECDGCATVLHTRMDPSHMRPKGWALFDEAEDAIRGGLCFEGGLVSVQGGRHLCPKCTKLVDDATPDNPTPEQVDAALKSYAL